MKVPAALKILAHEYAVAVDNDLALENGNLGECSPGTLKIRIMPGLADSVLADTLLHEVFEALNHHLALGLEHGALTALSEGLTAVIRDNGLDFRAASGAGVGRAAK